MLNPPDAPEVALIVPVAPSCPKTRECLNCPTVFEVRGGRHKGQLYCSDKCRNAAGNRDAAQGKPLMPLLKAWRLSRNSPSRRALGGQCLDEISRIIDMLIDDDRADGRTTPKLFEAAEARLAMGNYMDRERRTVRRRRDARLR